MLSRLELRGFKSFAQPVTLTFGPGVNVVVGPNGSGKSNLSEAVSWAMGEQRATRLRAPQMGDVIFSGGRGSGPAGFAEVRLAFAETDGAEEMELSRRLTRGGDSDYRINGSTCRLLDIQDELSTRGLGPDSLAVIRQGQVEAICMARPSDLRAMVDEAAGVGVAKRRRRRAEQKLVRVMERLDRARDLGAELTDRAKSLDRQARAAARAAEVEAEVLSARLAERLAIAALAHADLARASEVQARETALRDAARSTAGAARTDREAAEVAHAEAVVQLNRAVAALSALRTARERCDSRREIGEERIAAFLDRVGRHAEERRAAETEVGELTALSGEAAQSSLDAASSLEFEASAVRGLEATASEQGRQLRALAEAIEDRSRLRARLDRQVREAEIEQARRVDAHRQAAGRLATLTEPVPADDGRLERRLAIARERTLRREGDASSAASNRDDVRAIVTAAEERKRSAQSEVSRLQRASDRAGAPTLGAELRVRSGMERAVAAALGALADAPLAEDVGSAVAAVDGGSRAVVIPAPSRPRAQTPVGARQLLDVVESSGAGEAHIQRLLADCFLVDDLASVPPGAPGCFVTPEGHALRPAVGVVTGPVSAWATDALRTRAEADLASAETALAEARTTLTAAGERDEGLARRARAAARSAARAEERLAATHAERERRASSAQAFAREVVEREVALAQGKADLETLRIALVEVADDPDREGLNHATAAVEATAQSLAAATSRLSEARSLSGIAEARVGEIAARLAAAEIRASRPAADVPDLEPARDAIRASLGLVNALEHARADETAAAEEQHAAVAAMESALRAARAAQDEAERQDSAQRERAHIAEVALALAAERANEAGEAPGPEVEVETDVQALAERVAAAERRRVALGVVNPLAAEELREVADREREITDQVADLTAASESLSAHLAEMDRAVSAGFEEVFGVVAERYSSVIGRFFPGGEGKLSLVPPVEEGDEPGVEVAVVPAGKRSRALSLMSGGERSLVALAFLLALAMAKPAPVYMLDEVEAALDDVNLRRFLGAIRTLATDTQFIVITHQQPTVEIADTLFGITMGGDGTSQVISRRLARSVEGPARPFVRRALEAIPGGKAS